jgi:AcrR family transcriptional regulator
MSQSGSATAPRRRTTHGQQTRAAILKTAVNVASMEGLEGLSIGRLAAELGMSKSGLFAHFGSKEDLQLAAIETALDIFAAEVVQPARAAEPGMARLQTLVNAWLSYGERQVFPGGCFFAAVAVEFDSRPGVVRDRVLALVQQWLTTLEQIIQEAQSLGELDPTVDAAQLAFELNATMWGANAMLQLCNREQVVAQTKRAIAHRLGIQHSN